MEITLFYKAYLILEYADGSGAILEKADSGILNIQRHIIDFREKKEKRVDVLG